MTSGRYRWFFRSGMALQAAGVLAVVGEAPLALVTLTRALRGRFPLHKRIARWTLPIWLYVSVSGVVVYLMLYH